MIAPLRDFENPSYLILSFRELSKLILSNMDISTFSLAELVSAATNGKAEVDEVMKLWYSIGKFRIERRNNRH
jgi:hypothetical protein